MEDASCQFIRQEVAMVSYPLGKRFLFLLVLGMIIWILLSNTLTLGEK